ncbi:MAG: archaemetzincin [Pseudomonadota bacterium]
MRTIFLLLGLLVVIACFAMDFERPEKSERLGAIGPTKGLSETLRQAFDPGTDFDPIPVPGPTDWLAQHPEPGQTFEDFVGSNPNRPDAIRNKIYLQPLGVFQEDQSPSIDLLRDFTIAYFAMDVKVLPPMDISGAEFVTRINPYTGNRQILSSHILAFLKKGLPRDAFCLLAITMDDLYPHPSWNFVFGQASLHDRVGVFSFARYDPEFYGEPRGKEYHQLLLRRSLKVLVHETTHMFTLNHCIFFKCVMNGSNHLKESDSRPLHLCPVCLRKLQFSIEFDVAGRYDKLLQFYHKVGFKDENRWVSNRLKKILGSEKGK